MQHKRIIVPGRFVIAFKLTLNVILAGVLLSIPTHQVFDHLCSAKKGPPGSCPPRTDMLTRHLMWTHQTAHILLPSAVFF